MTLYAFFMAIGGVFFVFALVMWILNLDQRIDKVEAKIDELLKGQR